MRKLFLTIFLGLLLAVPAAASGDTPISWGNPHVSYTQYRADATQCTLAGIKAAQRQNGSPIAPSVAGGTLDDFLMRNQTRVMQGAKMWNDAGYAVIASCLTGLGYKPFRLTDDQAEHLKMLATGTDARHQYLYSLSVDTGILDRQAIPLGDTARR